jgi:hypothetical protein
LRKATKFALDISPLHVGERDPPGMPLACDIGLTGFTLGVERVELLLEPVVG